VPVAGGMALPSGSMLGGLSNHGPGQAGSGSQCSVNLKASLKMPTAPFPVLRRMRVRLDLDAQGIPLNGYEVVAQILTSAFKEELEPIHGQSAPGSLVSLTYVDEDGDDIMISSNHELAVAIHYAIRVHQDVRTPPGSEPTLRLTLHLSNSPLHATPLHATSLHATSLHAPSGGGVASVHDNGGAACGVHGEFVHAHTESSGGQRQWPDSVQGKLVSRDDRDTDSHDVT